MDVPLLVFWALAAAGVTAALLMVAAPNLDHAALYLIVTFFVVAAVFVLLRAEFLAAVQVLVYAGGIMVLYLFVILLVDVHGEEALRARPRRLHAATAALLTVLTMALLSWSVWVGRPASARTEIAAGAGNLETVAESLFRHYLLPFEAVSVLLL